MASGGKSTGAKHVIEGQHVYGGMVMGPMFPASALDAIKEFDFHDDDIIVATYPKAGTTWMQEILDLVMNGADTEKALEKPLMERVPFMEICVPGVIDCVQILKDRPPPRLIKTHLQRKFFDRMLKTKKTKVIVVMRNVKDNIVSYYHFYRSNWGLGNFSGSLVDFLELVDDKQLVHGDWFDFNLSWWAEKENPNIMFTTYEEMSKDIVPIIHQVAAFVGRTLTDEQVAKICKHVGFEAMSKNETIMEHFNMVMDPKISKFMRKGKVGDWRNHFSKEDSDKFDEQYRQKIVGTGLEAILSDGNQDPISDLSRI